MQSVVIMIGVCLNILVVIEGILAYNDGMFSPKQMILKGHQNGMPWITHFGASWGDFFIITPLVVAMLSLYGQQWSYKEHWKLIVLVFVITAAFHFLWSKNKMPDCLAWNGYLTSAGWVHLVYMSCVLTFIVLFYFCTSHIDPTFLVVVSILVTFHIAIGNHLLITILRPSWWPVTIPGLLNALAVTFGVGVALFIRCRYILAHQ